MRLKIQFFCAAFAIILVTATSVQSQTNLNVGARPLGMGETFTVIANDANAVFWNPAGLPLLQRGEVNFMHTNLYNTDISNLYVGAVYPLTGATAFGFGWTRIGLEDSDGIDNLNFSENILQASFGQRVLPFLLVGANVKFVDTEAGLDFVDANVADFNSNASGFGYDVGALLSWPWQKTPVLKDMRFGFTVTDIGSTEVKYNTGAKEAIRAQRYRLGAAWLPPRSSLFGLTGVQPTLAFEVDPEDRLHLGAELWLDMPQYTGSAILERIGLRSGLQEDLHTDEVMTVSFGASLKFKYAQIDYAYTVPPSLPATHRFSASLQFAPGTIFFKSIIDKVELMSVEPAEPAIFPSLLERYETDGVSTISLVNPRNEEIMGTVSVEARGDLYAPNRFTLTLLPKDTVVVPIRPLFNKEALPRAERTRVPYRIKFVYRYKEGFVDSTEFKSEIIQHDKNTIIWDDFRKAAALVHDRNPTVRKFVDDLLAQAAIGSETDNILTAIWLFEALTVKGFRFTKDGLPSHWTITPDSISFPEDEIKFPAELILSSEKAGDCDDLTTLFCSLLAHVGIESALIDAPRHIFLMFNSGLSSMNPLFFPIEPDYFIKREGRLWIPIEITDVSKDFLQAWTNGKNLYHELLSSGNPPRTVNLSDAWARYPPISLSTDTTGVGFTLEQISKIREKVKERIRALGKLKQQYVLENYGHYPDEPSLLNELGIVYVGMDSLKRAWKAFHKARTHQPDNAKVLNNLGNMHFIFGGEDSTEYYYERALSLNDTTMGIHLNLALFRYAQSLGAKAQSESRKAQFRTAQRRIATVLNNVGRMDSVLALLNIPVVSPVPEQVRGQPDDRDGFSVSSLLAFFKSVFSQSLETKVRWRVAGGKGLEPGARATIDFELKMNEQAEDPLNWPLEARALRMRDGRQETALPGSNSKNLSVNIKPHQIAGPPIRRAEHNYRIEVQNHGSQALLRDVEVIYILPPGVEIVQSNLEQKTLPIRNEDYENWVVSIGAQKFGVDKGHYLFWFN